MTKREWVIIIAILFAICVILSSCGEVRNPMPAPSLHQGRGKSLPALESGASSLAESRSSQDWRLNYDSESRLVHLSQKSELSQSPADVPSSGYPITCGLLAAHVELPVWHGLGIAGLVCVSGFGIGWWLGRRSNHG